MRRTLLLIVVSLLSVNSFGQTRRAPRAPAPQTVATKPNTQTLPIRRVILYSNGVAYIERRGRVSGHAEISLSFKQSQVDDVLKSMVVLDLGQGRIGAVSYNSSAPPSARMADIPFAIEAGTRSGNNGGLAGVLSQLQGARIIVATANRTATGSILTIEERRSQIDANKPPSQALVIASETTAEAKQLISRYVSKADTQETRLEQLNKEKQSLNGEAARLQGELEALIRGLTVEQKLTN